MQKITLAIIILISQLNFAKADEGMWLPILLKQLNEADMQSQGCKLSADDIYSINHTSLKDGVMLFGSGCTAELISDKGLILTNYHCGFSQIQQHSSIQNDYLTKGYWAMKPEEELPSPSISVTFIISMEDVTQQILFNISDTTNEALRDKIIKENSKTIEKKAVEGSAYSASVKPFYNGNVYYLFITETFTDVRLVGAPPESIGKFGDDTDNWMWPRHTGDFALFRIYANKENKPAPFSKDNVPYKPKFHFPISLKNVEKNDFTMVYGFPARTNEYLSSYAIEMIRNESNPVKIKLRDKKLDVLGSYMKVNDTIRIKYAAKYGTVSNAWKKWQGENKGLDKLKAIQLKKNTESTFLKNAILSNNQMASTVLLELEMSYKKFAPYSKQRDYYNEAFNAIELMNLSSKMITLIGKCEDVKYNKVDLEKDITNFKNGLMGFYKTFDIKVDKDLFSSLMKIYFDDMDSILPKEIFEEVKNKFNGNFKNYAAKIYDKSKLVSQESLNELMKKFPKNLSQLKKDPAIEIANTFMKYYDNQVKPTYTKYEQIIALQNRNYMKAQMDINTLVKFYPDANSTLRVAYGKVADYIPYDGAHYNYFTTTDGIIEKEKSNLDEYKVDSKLSTLINNKDYGQYTDNNGKMRIAFIATNHTTGGNSGSPVLNNKGQLIGTNFDRNWEGTMSDLMYNPSQVRNIILDIHYTLFIIDKYAGATHLINEMTIIK